METYNIVVTIKGKSYSDKDFLETQLYDAIRSKLEDFSDDLKLIDVVAKKVE